MGIHMRRRDASLSKQAGVFISHTLAGLHFSVQHFQLGQQDGGLQGIQAAVHAHTDVVVAPVLSVAGDLAHDGGQLVVIRKDGTAVAIAAQGFAGEEAGAGNRCQVAAFAAFVGRAKALRCIFDDRDAVLGGNGVDGVVVGTLAVEADGDDGFGSGGDGGFQLCRVEVAGARVNVYVHGFGAEQDHGFCGGNVSKAGGDDFIAWAYAQRHLGNLQGIGAVGYGDTVFGTGVGAELFFQFSHFRAQDVLAVGKDAGNARIDVGFQALVLGFEVDEVHGVEDLDVMRYCCKRLRGLSGKVSSI